MSERVLHCWMGRREWIEATRGEEAKWDDYAENECDGTCMLEAEHEGPHEFTPDDEIVIEFAAAQVEGAQ